MRIEFYSRPNCALCEEGLRTLKLVQEDVAFDLEVMNIEQDDALHEKYMLMIPVVVLDGKILQYGQLDYPTLLEAIMEH